MQNERKPRSPGGGHQITENNGDISPELRQLLEEEAIGAEIEAAVDAGLEQGMIITREDAIRILHVRILHEREIQKKQDQHKP